MNVAGFILDVFSAVGTLGATILALWLAVHDKMRRVDAVFVWGPPTDYKPMLYIKNMGSKAVVMDCIILKFRKKVICKIAIFDSYDLREFATIKPGEEVMVPFGGKIPKIVATKDKKQKHHFDVIIIPRQGKRFISRQKYSFMDLEGLLFGERLFTKD